MGCIITAVGIFLFFPVEIIENPLKEIIRTIGILAI
jgi:hypothetical protein